MHFYLLFAVVIMICVFHTLGVKHGQNHLDIRFWMNGGLGLPMDKLQGTFISLFYFHFSFPHHELWNSILTWKNYVSITIALNGWFSFCFYTFLKQWFSVKCSIHCWKDPYDLLLNYFFVFCAGIHKGMITISPF